MRPHPSCRRGVGHMRGGGLMDPSTYWVLKGLWDLCLQEQYIFVYEALLEALKAGNTAIPCSDFEMTYEGLCAVDPEKGKSKLQEQYEVWMEKL